ncbi:MAG: hypothetical protein EA361_01860 [Bacteroidetes bacterium]|nr:MAG: hypothetical protein EA361_01860 [Bacteroidota bacterium]
MGQCVFAFFLPRNHKPKLFTTMNLQREVEQADDSVKHSSDKRGNQHKAENSAYPEFVIAQVVGDKTKYGHQRV